MTRERERERALKALKLNGDISYDYDYDTRLLSASSKRSKPTIRIKRLSFNGSNSIKLKGASSIREEREKEKAEKALRSNGIV